MLGFLSKAKIFIIFDILWMAKIGVLIFRISIVLKGLYCCDKAQDHNKLEEGRAYLAYTSASHSSQKEVRAEAQDRNLEVGTEAEAMQGRCLLACCHGLFSLLSYNTQDTSPVVALPVGSWALPHQACITGLSTGRSYGSILYAKVLSSEMTLAVSSGLTIFQYKYL